MPDTPDGVRQHRYRPVHRSPVWTVRVCCVLALAGVVSLVASRVPPAERSDHPPMPSCAVLRSFVDIIGAGIVEDPTAGPDYGAVYRANAQLDQIRAYLDHVLADPDSGCGQ